MLLMLWARPGVPPEHASSTAESTADDHLTLDGDTNCCREREVRCDAAGTLMHISARWLLDGGTQSMPLSAAIKQRLV